MKRLLAAFCISLAIYMPLTPALADAAFNPGEVLSDEDLTDVNVPDDYAQKFLESHGSGIARMTFLDIDGTRKKPGDLITYYAKEYDINPRYLLALIQKEQSLVTDPNPGPCQIDWAAGYGRPDGSTCNDPNWQKHRGFTSQIVGAASFARYFYDQEQGGAARGFGYFPGTPATIDGTAVIPANTATAMLYSYTPHLHGNQLLSSIWTSWFATVYPDGSYLSASDGTVYVIQSGMKRPFATRSAWRSRVDPSRVIPAADDILARYPDGPSIKFADFSLVRVPSGGIYLLVHDVKRPIQSMRVFRSIGFNPEEVDDVDPADLAGYAAGDAITLKSAYPTGALLRQKGTSHVWYAENGVKHAIVSYEIMRTDFPGKKISVVSKSALDDLKDGDSVKFRDGELITSPGSNRTVFVISNGKRRPIASGGVFEGLGYAWNRVIATSDAAVNLHPLGAPISVDAAAASAPVQGDMTFNDAG